MHVIGRVVVRGLVAGVLALGAVGCGGGGSPPLDLGSGSAALSVTSSAVGDGGSLPSRFTCSGEGAVPDLSWQGPADGAAGYVLTVEDPDAPGRTFVHWTVADIPATTTRLTGRELPSGAVEGTNGFGDTGWGAPCPPAGDDAHHYRFTVYAVDTSLDLQPGFAPATLQDAVQGHVVGQGALTATFARSG